MYEGNGVVM